MSTYAHKPYSVRYVHKISPSPNDVRGEVLLPDSAFSDKRMLARYLRETGVMLKGTCIRDMRVEGDRVVVFPLCPGLSTYWHSIILTTGV